MTSLLRVVLLAVVLAMVIGPGSALAVRPVANDDVRSYDEDDCVLAAPSDCTIDVFQNDMDAAGANVDGNSRDEQGNPIELSDVIELNNKDFFTATAREDKFQVGYRADRDYCNAKAGQAPDPDTFTYKISGGDTAKVSVTVNCVDDAPVAASDSYNLDEDTAPPPYDVLANDKDVDGPAPQIASITQPDKGGTASIVQGKISYRPKTNFCLTESMTYTLAGATGSPGTAKVTFEVDCNDQDDPVAVDDVFTVGFNSGTTILPVLTNDYDPDDYGDPSGWDAIEILGEELTQPLNGTAALLDGGDARRADRIAYTPNPGFCGTDSFLYRVVRPRIPQARVTVTVPCPALPAASNGGGLVTGGGVLGSATTPAAITTAKAGTAKVSGTSLKVPLRCTGTTSCVISMGLSITGEAKASAKKTVVIGKAKVTLKAGQKRTVTVKLNAAGKRALKKSRRLKAKLKITLGAKTLSTRTVTFKAAKKKR